MTNTNNYEVTKRVKELEILISKQDNSIKNEFKIQIIESICINNFLTNI